jgi:translation initiation factor 2 beta subunit (eIF-2beta)/eIF-5
MTRETGLSLTANSLPRVLQPLVKCKICKKKATCCFVTSEGRFVLFCEPCFEVFNVFYKHEIGHGEQLGIIIEGEL